MLVILMNTFVGYMESALMLKEETDRLDTIEQLALNPKVRPMVFEAAGFLKIIEVNRKTAARACIYTMFQEFSNSAIGEPIAPEGYLRPP